MKSMSFIPELKVFLKANGAIYTVRKYNMAAAQVEVEDVGKCSRAPLGRVRCKEDLVSYARGSGFATLEDWWSKIKQFIPSSADSMFLYWVRVVKLEERSDDRSTYELHGGYR